MATIPRHEKLLRRSRSNRIFGGVCGGLAQYFDTDVWLIRLAFVVVAILMGSGLLLYIVLWILLPLESESAVDTKRGG